MKVTSHYFHRVFQNRLSLSKVLYGFFEEINAIAKAPTQKLKEKGIRAAAVFWFLSGIRIGAFVPLPIKAIDLENRRIRQWPKLGLRTKFRKHQTTYFLNIPELFEVITDWDGLVISQLTIDHPWFANISPKMES